MTKEMVIVLDFGGRSATSWLPDVSENVTYTAKYILRQNRYREDQSNASQGNYPDRRTKQLR